MGKSREIGKDYVGLCKINFWIFALQGIYNNKEVEDE